MDILELMTKKIAKRNLNFSEICLENSKFLNTDPQISNQTDATGPITDVEALRSFEFLSNPHSFSPVLEPLG